MLPCTMHRVFSDQSKYKPIWEENGIEHYAENDSRHNGIHHKPKTHPKPIEGTQRVRRYQTPSKKHDRNHPWLPRPIQIEQPRQYQAKEAGHHRCKHPSKVSQAFPIEFWYFSSHDNFLMTFSVASRIQSGSNSSLQLSCSVHSG